MRMSTIMVTVTVPAASTILTVVIVVVPASTIIIIASKGIGRAASWSRARGLGSESWVRKGRIITIQKPQALLMEKKTKPQVIKEKLQRQVSECSNKRLILTTNAHEIMMG